MHVEFLTRYQQFLPNIAIEVPLGACTCSRATMFTYVVLKLIVGHTNKKRVAVKVKACTLVCVCKNVMPASLSMWFS